MNLITNAAAKRCFAVDGPLSKSFWTAFKPKFGAYDVVTDPGDVSGPRTVPDGIPKPSYWETGNVVDEPDQHSAPEIHTAGQIESLRRSCRLAKLVLDSVQSRLRAGVTTDDVDGFVHDLIVSRDAYPSPLNYNGFKKSVCTSVNNVVCHGVPDDRPLRDGDLVSVDVSVYKNGYHGDCAATYCVGPVDEPGRKLMSVAEQCMYRGIGACGPGKSFVDIGVAIERFVRQNGLSVIDSITGHGIGSYFHGPPVIFHSSLHLYPGIMKPGMVFTVEPVICQGSKEIEMWDDGWTIAMVDNSRGAQFEHTILITEDGYEILTV